MKLLSIIGARPQFIKCAPLSRTLRKDHQEILVHTGQHYDQNMSDVFFSELNIPKPDYNLAIGSASHGEQTGQMLIEIEKVIQKEEPDMVLVYGDTNSTIAGALAASKVHIPVAHVEAGLRSFDRTMPEEINRVLTDHVSDLLFCPTETAVKNLKAEGITTGVHNVGDVMMDAVLYNSKIAEEKSTILADLDLNAGQYLLATVHRASNTDSRQNLTSIINAFVGCGETIVFPVHPRTAKYMKQYGLWEKASANLVLTEPVGYLDMLKLTGSAKKVLTDSGGLQKEACMLGVPCITLRENTEWVETVEAGWNVLVGAENGEIFKQIREFEGAAVKTDAFGCGDACEKILEKLNSITIWHC
jgi:UDP-N-acetylglucosamine 2-epimerase (non-hydrolysing)